MITYNTELERMERKTAIPGRKMTEKNFWNYLINAIFFIDEEIKSMALTGLPKLPHSTGGKVSNTIESTDVHGNFSACQNFQMNHTTE